MNSIKGHILDSLGAFYHLLFDVYNECRVGKDFDRVDMKVFFLAVRGIADIGLHATEHSSNSAEISVDKNGELYDLNPDSCYLLDRAFPHENRGNLYGHGWLPLHWALVTQSGLARDELNGIISKEVPKAITQKPSHQILGRVLASSTSPCMDMVVQISTKLPRIFHSKAVCDQYPLHVAARYSGSVPFIQHVIQRNPAALEARSSEELLPLHYSVLNPCKGRYEIFTTLAEAYPEAIDAVDDNGDTVLHWAVQTSTPSIDIIKWLIARCPEMCPRLNSGGQLSLHRHLIWCKGVIREDEMSILQLLVDGYRDGLSIEDNVGNLPVHLAAFNGRLDLVEYLLEQYPQGVYATDNTRTLAVAFDNVSVTKWVCSKYPQSLQVPDSSNCLALHDAAFDGNYEQATLVWATYPEAIAMQDSRGRLPIHDLCEETGFDSELCPRTELLRFLIRHHPTSVSVLTNAGKTAYSLLCSTSPDATFVHRILLRVYPDLDMAAYRRLNYEARRMALFLAFSAVTSGMHEQNLLRRLTFQNMELLKEVVSYL